MHVLRLCMKYMHEKLINVWWSTNQRVYAYIWELKFGFFSPSSSLKADSESKTEDFVIISKSNNEAISTEEKDLYPGKIIPFELGDKKLKEPTPVVVQNEEGELNDEEEEEKMQTEKVGDDSTKKIKLNEFIEINQDKSPSDCVLLTVANLGNQSIKIGSHFNFIEANKSLQFDRSASFGMRLVKKKKKKKKKDSSLEFRSILIKISSKFIQILRIFHRATVSHLSRSQLKLCRLYVSVEIGLYIFVIIIKQSILNGHK